MSEIREKIETIVCSFCQSDGTAKKCPGECKYLKKQTDKILSAFGELVKGMPQHELNVFDKDRRAVRTPDLLREIGEGEG